MPRLVTKMTDKKLKTITKDTACGIVPGLMASVRTLKDGSIARYFVLRYQKDGKQVKYNLGVYPQMTLAQAFTKAKEWRDKLDAGENPQQELIDKRNEKIYNDGISIEALVWKWVDFETKRGKWSTTADKTKEDIWRGFFKNHFTKELRELPVVKLTPEILAEHFSEKWQTMIDTPERILGDLRNAIDWGMRQKHIPLLQENPAQISRGRLGDLLPLTRPQKSHEPALAPDEIPDFFAVLADAIPVSQSARALAYAILTAARNSTARESSWDEIILDDPKQGNFQLIPRERMKIKGEKLPFDRKTPLSKEALALLKTAPRMAALGEKDWVFPNIRNGRYEPVSEDMLSKCIKDMHRRKKAIDGIGWVDRHQKTKLGEFRRVTPHGVARASFKTWANDAAGYKHSEFREATLDSCLDHSHEKYANAYDREQALGDMRRVFDAWGEFCFSKLTEEQKKRLGL